MKDQTDRWTSAFAAAWRRAGNAITVLAVCGAVSCLALAAVQVTKARRARRASRRRLAVAATPQVAGPAVDFTREVKPILVGNCLKCHGAEKQKGGFRLDARVDAFKGGKSGAAAIVAGDAEKSDLVRRIASEDSDEWMPPEGSRLAPEKVELLRRWVNQGASWPETARAGGAPRPSGGMIVTDEDRRHWAFRALGRIQVPETTSTAWPRTPIDQFVLSAQEAVGLHPNPLAPRRTLIRRLYFDLVGLPPPPEEVDSFEQDESPDAYERLVDRLLANPHFGELWGRHWLDSARYADSAGYEEDRPRPNAFHYRDFVIRAINQDLPFDRFVQWQIAGDLLEPQNNDAIAATGFLAAAPDVLPTFINFRKKDRCDELDDVVATTGSAILGLTLGCARCHDHKFDPIPMVDYYRMTAFFTSTEREERPMDVVQEAEYERRETAYQKRHDEARKKEKTWLEQTRDESRKQKIAALPLNEDEKALLRAKVDLGNERQARLLKRFETELDVTDETLRETLSKSDLAKWEALDQAAKAVETAKPADIPRLLAIHEGQPQKTFVLARGDPDRAGVEVTAGTLTVLSPANAGGPAPGAASRADLARWLTDDVRGAGALAARVAVNRLWQHHFGRGLVSSSGDFGRRGELPSNPELLDWLAAELIRNGWRMKPLHKMILMSAVYRQGVGFDPARAAIDPENRRWWRREPMRIEAETLRDAILSVSGHLNTQIFGPSVKPRMNPEAISVTNPLKRYDEWPKDVVDGPATRRRSVYVFIKRANLFPFLQAFDAPNAIGSCTRRNPTTVSPQALALMNDQFVRAEARAFAERLQSCGSIDARVCTAFELALGRKPDADEAAKSIEFVTAQSREYLGDSRIGEPGTAALCDFCQGLIASNEFSYAD